MPKYIEEIEIAATDIETKNNALMLIKAIEDTMSAGSVYIRKSDKQKLITVRGVLETMVDEGVVLYYPPAAEIKGSENI